MKYGYLNNKLKYLLHTSLYSCNNPLKTDNIYSYCVRCSSNCNSYNCRTSRNKASCSRPSNSSSSRFNSSLVQPPLSSPKPRPKPRPKVNKEFLSFQKYITDVQINNNLDKFIREKK